MSASPSTEDSTIKTLVHDPDTDAHHEATDQPHDQEAEVRHAWEHFHENWKFFACFLAIILLTVFAFNVNFGSEPLRPKIMGMHFNFGSWNLVATLVLAALRSALIAFFLATLFKNFSFVFRTLFFTAVFLAGMIWLSLWDSSILPGTVGDPITDKNHPKDYIP